MSIRKFLNRVTVAVTVLAGTATLATAAPTFTPWGRITTLQNGWVVDRMLVFQGNAPLTNPDGCSLVTNGYIINESDAGHRTQYAMLLGALLNQREVTMVISGCFQNRPRIISVAVR
jgi:hypothetical protein